MTVTTRSPALDTDYSYEYVPSGSFAGHYGKCNYCGLAYREASKDAALSKVAAHVSSSHPDKLRVSLPEPPPEPSPYIPPPPPPPPVTPPEPPFGEILRIALPDEICHDVPIPVLTVVRNRGDLSGNFRLVVENTELKETYTQAFSLGGKEMTSVRITTVIPKQETDLRFTTYHDGTRDDSEIAHVKPTVFGFAHVDSFILPVTMRPGRDFDVEVTIRNTGECRDNFLTTVTDTATGKEVFSEAKILGVGETATFKFKSTMPGRLLGLEARTHRAGVGEWILNDIRLDKVKPDECILLNVDRGFCEFRGPLARYAGSIMGSDIELFGIEKKEERAVVMPGARFASFAGRADRGEVNRIEFTTVSDFRARTELGIASVLNEAVTNVDTKEFKYSTILPRPLIRSLKVLSRRS